MFAITFIKILFLSACFTVPLRCGLNDSDLPKVIPRNLEVRLNDTVLSPMLMDGFQSNSMLVGINKVDSLFVLLRFHFLL